jgi:hypothetical protein
MSTYDLTLGNPRQCNLGVLLHVHARSPEGRAFLRTYVDPDDAPTNGPDGPFVVLLQRDLGDLMTKAGSAGLRIGVSPTYPQVPSWSRPSRTRSLASGPSSSPRPQKPRQ